MIKQVALGVALSFGSIALAQEKKPAAAPAKSEPAKAPGTAAKPAEAPPAAPAAPPAPPTPGPETTALKPFVQSMTWVGKMPAGSMGPGSPEMTSKGKSTCKWIMNNLWAACDLEDHTGTGKQSMTWKGHWVVGWDFGAKEYRGVMADSFGTATMFSGKLDGTKLVFESQGEVDMMGMKAKVRTTMDAADPKAIKFTSEHQAKGQPWVVDGESVMKPGK